MGIFNLRTTKLTHAMNKTSKSPSSVTWRCVQRLVRRLSAWALRDELRLQQNVNEDAQALVDALLRGERADAYCGYGRDGQATNYRDELWFSLRALKPNSGVRCHSERRTNRD